MDTTAAQAVKNTTSRESYEFGKIDDRRCNENRKGKGCLGANLLVA